MNRAGALAINAVGFHVLWLVTILGVPVWWFGPVVIALAVVAQVVAFSPAPVIEGMVIVGGAALGVLLDVLSVGVGFLRFRGDGLSPQFVIVFFMLWINFGGSLRPTFGWLWRRPFAAAALGGVGGALTYWAASRLGHVTFPEPSWRGPAWAGVQYALAVPAWMIIARRALPTPQGDRRRSEPGAPTREGTQA